AVDRRAAADQIAQRELVQVAAREDGDLLEAAPIEDRAYPPGVVGEVAAVEANAVDADAARPEARAEYHHLLGRGLRIVGVEQEDDVLRLCLGEAEKRLRLVRVRLHEGVRHGPEERHSEAHPGEYVRRAREAREIARSRREQSGFRPVGTTEPEVDKHLP